MREAKGARVPSGDPMADGFAAFCEGRSQKRIPTFL